MDVTTRIRSYFSHVIREPVGDHDDVFDLGIVDSLFAMQLVMFVEREFSIVAEREDLDIRNFCSISALAAFVELKLALATASEATHGHSAQ
jgi:methoxymalonate biosynthesis acyl carrier protein